jgi:hypothetical protein
MAAVSAYIAMLIPLSKKQPACMIFKEMDDVKRQGIQSRWHAGKFKKRGNEARVQPRGRAM